MSEEIKVWIDELCSRCGLAMSSCDCGQCVKVNEPQGSSERLNLAQAELLKVWSVFRKGG